MYILGIILVADLGGFHRFPLKPPFFWNTMAASALVYIYLRMAHAFTRVVCRGGRSYVHALSRTRFQALLRAQAYSFYVRPLTQMQATATIFSLSLNHSHDNLYPLAFGSKSHVKIVAYPYSCAWRRESLGTRLSIIDLSRTLFTRARGKIVGVV